MDKRGRIPGPIQKNLSVGNLDDLVNSGVSRWQTIDVHDGSWTLNNVDSILVNNSSSSAGMRFETDYNQKASRWNATNQDVPRFYKKLAFDNGQLVKWSDKFQIEFLIERVAVHGNTSTADRSGITVGIADTSCQSLVSDVEWMGLQCSQQLNRTVGGVANTLGLQTQVGGDGALAGNSGDATNKGYGIIAPNFDEEDSDGNTSTLHGMCFGLNTSLEAVNHSASGANTHEYVGTDDVYIFLATMWTGSVTISENSDATWKAWYRINFLENFLTPEWQLNGGQSR
jgi:hypothetical protein|tara:strand:+ start:857 stop:1711 length:855 start_codon:yes stop_codon:yes gene_type:complete